jgi:glutamate-1-semialdehyde 2,1-aminomutase
MATDSQASSTPVSSIRRERQLELYRRASKTLPGGTDSNFRAWGEDTIYIDRGKGGRIWDLDQNEFIDLRMG